MGERSTTKNNGRNYQGPSRAARRSHVVPPRDHNFIKGPAAILGGRIWYLYTFNPKHGISKLVCDRTCRGCAVPLCYLALHRHGVQMGPYTTMNALQAGTRTKAVETNIANSALGQRIKFVTVELVFRLWS